MSIFTKILGSKAVETVTNSIGPIVDNLTTSDDEKSNAKTQLTSVVLNSLVQVVEAQKRSYHSRDEGQLAAKIMEAVNDVDFWCNISL